MRPLYLVPLAFLSLSACVVHETAPQPTTTTIVTPAPAPSDRAGTRPGDSAHASVFAATGHDHNAISRRDAAFKRISAEPTPLIVL
jgi:hypothetical protein